MPPGAPVDQYHFDDGEDDLDGDDCAYTCKGCIEHSAAKTCATCVENMLNIAGMLRCHMFYALICFQCSNIQYSLKLSDVRMR